MHGEGTKACGDLGQDVDLVRHFSFADLQLFPLDVLRIVYCRVEMAVPLGCYSNCQTLTHETVAESGSKAKGALDRFQATHQFHAKGRTRGVILLESSKHSLLPAGTS